jgi:peptidyl-prolyl cis-trans isomerase D
LYTIEQSIKSQILIAKLQELVASTAVVSPGDVYQEYCDRNEKVQVKYLFISEANIDTAGIAATDDEIKARYEKDKDSDYKTEATATLRYVLFPTSPSQADIDLVKTEIEDIYSRAIKGDDFAALAKEFSQDNSAQNGGDVGWFAKGRMVPEFEATAFGLKNIGDIAPPVRTQFGWHIIKLTGKKSEKNAKGVAEDQIQVSHILLKTTASAKTLVTLKDEAENVRQLAISTSFDQAVKDKKLTVQETKGFLKGQNIREFGANKKMVDFGFDANPGSISELADSRQGYYFTTPGTKKPAGYRPLEEVKTQLAQTIRMEKIANRAFDKGMTLYDDMNKSGFKLDQLGSKYNLPVKETKPFARYEFVENVGSDPAFIGAAFGLTSISRFSKPVKARMGCYLLEYVMKTEVDKTQYAAMADSLYNATATKKRNDIWQNWYRNLTTDAKIEDYRTEVSGS